MGAMAKRRDSILRRNNEILKKMLTSDEKLIENLVENSVVDTTDQKIIHEGNASGN